MPTFFVGTTDWGGTMYWRLESKIQ